MKWSEAHATLQTICQRLEEAGSAVGLIPDALYLLSVPADFLEYVSLLLTYHEIPLSDDERERLYRRVAYRIGPQLAPVQGVTYLTSGLSQVVLEAIGPEQYPEAAIKDGACLIWKPGLDWQAALCALITDAPGRSGRPVRRDHRKRLSYGRE